MLARRFNPSCTYLSHENDRSKHEELHPSKSTIETYLEQRRSFGSITNPNLGQFSGAFHRSGSMLVGSGLCLNRYMSTSIGKENKTNYAADVITDAPMEVVSEVAIAAADFAFPVAAFQYLIDGVHSYTGLEWWACIALTTLIIRGATVPILISLLKANSKLKLLMPRLQEINGQMKETGMEPQAIAEGQKKINELLKENMAEKVPSFKNGGALWFTDLTTPDAMYIFPVLMALTVLAMAELNVGLEGNPAGATMKKFSRGIAVLTVPLTMNFPPAMFCYWITSNLFSFCYGSVLRVPGVKKALGVPDIPVTPPSTSQNKQSCFSFQDLKQASSMNNNTPAIASAAVEKHKSLYRKTSSTAALSQRLRKLEKQVKQKKRMKKR